MTKADLIEEIVEQTGIPRKEVATVVNEMLKSLKRAFLHRERVEFRGFGVFVVVNRKPRVGRNPKTRQEVRIPERPTVVFKVSKAIQRNIPLKD